MPNCEFSGVCVIHGYVHIQLINSMSGQNHAYFLDTPYLKVLKSALILSLQSFFLPIMFDLLSPLFHILIYYNHNLCQTLPLYMH
jgi:hypothetical protein